MLYEVITFLYRWGNPKNYQRGDSTDMKISNQHDVRWIEDGMPGAGNLTLFDGGVTLLFIFGGPLAWFDAWTADLSYNFV